MVSYHLHLHLLASQLADKNPKNYIAMAPKFFNLLTTSSNNWMLIKVVKLLGSLVPEEPRLARKLLEPLATIIQNTSAKSLLYECIHTVTLSLPFTKKDDGSDSSAVPTIVKLCSEHLKQFVQDADQNLKYLGLVGFVNLMQSHPRAVAESRELILACLSDDDVTIRTRALELLTGMVTKKTLEDLVTRLLGHVRQTEPGGYKSDLITKIVYICSRDKYAFLQDFEWYMGVLVQLSRIDANTNGSSLASGQHGALLSAQLMDVALRVESVREYAVGAMIELLLEQHEASISQIHISNGQLHVLTAAAWIVGEYCNDHMKKFAAKASKQQQQQQQSSTSDGTAAVTQGLWVR
jgi:AP-3 complex subunit delta